MKLANTQKRANKLVGSQIDRKEVSGLPVAGLQVDQYGQFAGVQIAYPGKQLKALALAQVFQAVDEYRQIKAACRQFGGQRPGRCLGELAVWVRGAKCLGCGQFGAAH